MKSRLTGNVTIPQRPRSIGGLLEWARHVTQCLTELRDRKISGGNSPSSRGGGGTVTGLFCRTFISGLNWKLTGGVVYGGTGNVSVPDITLGTVTPPPVDGTQTWLVCSGNAVTEDDLIMPGFNLTSVTVASGESLPTPNTIPTNTAPAGVLYVSLGMWSNGKFIPSGCGNIQINHCPGTLTAFRQIYAP
jgi:hypothetical protein